MLSAAGSAGRIRFTVAAAPASPEVDTVSTPIYVFRPFGEVAHESIAAAADAAVEHYQAHRAKGRLFTYRLADFGTPGAGHVASLTIADLGNPPAVYEIWRAYWSDGAAAEGG
jgi:hypothetical protein